MTAIRLITGVVLMALSVGAQADERTLVQLPPMMQQHMLGNMRDHLRSLNEILQDLVHGDGDKAADVAEQRLGMSSLEAHGASHMAPYMPPAMQAIGTEMHHAASRFAQVAQEGDLPAAYAALAKVTVNCVACHEAYRIR